MLLNKPDKGSKNGYGRGLEPQVHASILRRTLITILTILVLTPIAELLGAQLLLSVDAKASKAATRTAGENTDARPIVVARAPNVSRGTYFQPYPPMQYAIRVGLLKRVPVARFCVWEPGAIFVNNQPVFDLQPRLVYTIANGQVRENSTGRTFSFPTTARALISSPDYRVWAANGWWRGSLEIIRFGNTFNVINVLDLEEYLLGVVPAEMPASWHLEALKAQAVAARSYAAAHMGKGSKWYNSQGYDVLPTVADQAYKGLAREAPSTFRAVQETRAIILKNANKVKAGFYRATVGGSGNMETNLNIRKSVVATSKLQSITGVPDIQGVTIKQWDPVTANANSIQIIGSAKTREVSGIHLAKMLGFSTAGILNIDEQGNSWVFTYRGPGNGMYGLSQNGANMLAKRGWRFDQILQQYYQDPDGKLHLDLMDTYKPMYVRRIKQKAISETQENEEEADPEMD